ncbi:MAG: hypothetical protein ACTSXP_03270 [Promethearchaeota archaeon]
MNGQNSQYRILICPNCGFQFNNTQLGTIRCPQCNYIISETSSTRETVPPSSGFGSLPQNDKMTMDMPIIHVSEPRIVESTRTSGIGGGSSPALNAPRVNAPRPVLIDLGNADGGRGSSSLGITPIVARGSSRDSKPVLIPIHSRSPRDSSGPTPPAPVQPEISNVEDTGALFRINDDKPKNLASLQSIIQNSTEREAVPPVKPRSERSGGVKPRMPPRIEIPDATDLTGVSSETITTSVRPSARPTPMPKPRPATRSTSPTAIREKIHSKESGSVRHSVDEKSLEHAMKETLKNFKVDLGVTFKDEKPTPSSVSSSLDSLRDADPQSLGDILKGIIKIDNFVKASALVRRDGTILASAITTRMTDSLLAIIATTVANIGKDVIFSTGSGSLKYITFAGTKGIIHLVPVLTDISLIVFTDSRSRRGVIEVISKYVEKKLKQYLNI